jgi:hypothetical protein
MLRRTAKKIFCYHLLIGLVCLGSVRYLLVISLPARFLLQLTLISILGVCRNGECNEASGERGIHPEFSNSTRAVVRRNLVL